METVTAAAASFNRYPDMACTSADGRAVGPLRGALAHLAAGTGSVGVAQQLIQATSGPGDEVIYAWRSFEAYLDHHADQRRDVRAGAAGHRARCTTWTRWRTRSPTGLG